MKNPADLKKQIIEAIKKYKLVNISEVASYIGISRTTFYKYEFDEDEEIIDLINKNRIKFKQLMREKWFNSDSATLQIAFYKLIGTKDELNRLSGSKQDIDITTAGQPIAPIINFVKNKKDDSK